MNPYLRQVGFFDYMPMDHATTLLGQEIDRFIKRHGGLDEALPDLSSDGDEEDREHELPAGVNAGVIFFSDGAVLGREKMTMHGTPGQWSLMSESPAEGSMDLLSRLKTYWRSKLTAVTWEYEQIRRDALAFGDVDSVPSVKQAAEVVRVAKSAYRTILRSIENHPTEVAKREAEARAQAIRAQREHAERSRRERVKTALEGISVADGQEELPLVERIARKAEQTEQRRQFVQ